MTSATLPDCRPALTPAWLGAHRRPALGDVVRVARLGGHREVGAVSQTGDRAEQVVGELAVLAGVQQHLVDVPVGVVVGEDRGPQVLRAARRLQVARCAADRVPRVVGIPGAVPVGVSSVRLPGRGHELHPAHRPRGGDIEVGAEGGLDPVDRRQHLPGDPVLGAAGLIDAEQEGRDRELVDQEARDPDRGRAEVGDREGGVGPRRDAVGGARRRPAVPVGAGRAAAAVARAVIGSVATRSARAPRTGSAAAAREAAASAAVATTTATVPPPPPPPPSGGGGGGGGGSVSSPSEALEQPGSARSTRPSPSSSFWFEHAERSSGGGPSLGMPPPPPGGSWTWPLTTAALMAVPRTASATVSRSFRLIGLGVTAQPGRSFLLDTTNAVPANSASSSRR